LLELMSMLVCNNDAQWWQHLAVILPYPTAPPPTSLTGIGGWSYPATICTGQEIQTISLQVPV
jgi:hypothetical protein